MHILSGTKRIAQFLTWFCLNVIVFDDQMNCRPPYLIAVKCGAKTDKSRPSPDTGEMYFLKKYQLLYFFSLLFNISLNSFNCISYVNTNFCSHDLTDFWCAAQFPCWWTHTFHMNKWKRLVCSSTERDKRKRGDFLLNGVQLFCQSYINAAEVMHTSVYKKRTKRFISMYRVMVA